jgi:hypothetical protein
MSELRAQVAEAVKDRRLRNAKTKTKQKYLKMSKTDRECFGAGDKIQAWSLHHKIAVSAAESEEEKAN